MKEDRRDFRSRESLGYLVNRTARTFAVELDRRLRRHGVRVAQWAVLLFLWEEDGLSQAELSRLVAIEPPTMVHTLERMVRDGLVTRQPDSADRRVTRIHLTARGTALRSKLVPEAQATNRQLTAALSETEVRRLRELLQRLVLTWQGR